MATSSSGKNSKSKSSKNTYRAASGKSRGGKSGAARGTSQKRVSKIEQRRAQQQNLVRSVVLFCLGILLFLLAIWKGESTWNLMHGWMHGVFGVLTLAVGPLLMVIAYLLGTGRHVGIFIAKTSMLALLIEGFAVVFSPFKVGDTPWQTVKMLFSWGQTRFWTGGVLGVPVGASLVALCGRPAANFVMIIVILMGIMVFCAISPVQVVQYIYILYEGFREKRAARVEEEHAYDTHLFAQEAEEESLESLTGSLPPLPEPAAPAEPAPPAPGTRRPFDVAPYLEQEDAARRNAQAQAAARAGQTAVPDTATYPDLRAQTAQTGQTTQFARPVPPVPAAPIPPAPAAPQSAARAEFDVDLGLDASERALANAVMNDPLQKIEIGDGGTFGLDPLKQLNHRKNSPEPPAPEPPRESFELHLEPEDASAPEEESLNDLIQRAVAGREVPVAGADVGLPEEEEPESFEMSLTPEPSCPAPEEDLLPELPAVPGDPAGLADPPIPAAVPTDPDSFETTLSPAPTPSRPAVSGIPTLGGSFDAGESDPARAAWDAGIPVSDLLSGRVSVAAPASPAAPDVPPSAPARQTFGAAEHPTARLRVSSSIGNSASAPISSPPSAAKAAPASDEEDGGDAADEARAAFAEQTQEYLPYTYPSLNLFNAAAPEDERGAAAEMKKNADTLVSTLDSFGVRTRILDICHGPSVTRYELQPEMGVKVSRITSLADDIALNLATAGVRIEAPIPGKPAVGIEVPNKIRTTVSIRGVFESQNYINMRSPLTMALGKDIAGTAQVADLCKMPHLLIAGSTGSGKSVCVNSIIISFLFRSGPEDVKLILIDPKVVELAEYNGIPHLLMPVVTEPRKAAGALGASVAEMERRYQLFAQNNVRDIKSYNKLAKANPDVLEHLPYIAIIIDELADLMMVAGKEVEDYICRIAQKARAAGIHLIVATQRPSVDVITGLIKANIPSRIAFAVSSQIDSRTILDTGGADKLLGNGDMLFLPVGAAKPVRVQGTFVTDEEISAVLNFIKSTSSAQYDEEMIAEMERRAVAEKGGKGKADADDDGGALDPMFEQAVACVIEAGQASTSLLQRRCKLGYARAARIMDQMEQEKIIGPYEGAKPRAVLLTRAQWQERCLGQNE